MQKNSISPLHNISYGIYILTSKSGDKFNGQIVNAVIQTTSEPATIAVCVNKKNLTHKFIQDSKLFNLSILSKNAPISLIKNFGFQSGKDVDKFKEIEFIIGKNGVPVVKESSIAFIELELINFFDVGTHTIFIGKVLGLENLTNEEPMTYKYYSEVKRGKTPINAPHFIKGGKEMDSYVCTVCGYVYNPSEGDPDNDVVAGTKFEDIPENWVCPVCGADKSEFEKE